MGNVECLNTKGRHISCPKHHTTEHTNTFRHDESQVNPLRRNPVMPLAVGYDNTHGLADAEIGGHPAHISVLHHLEERRTQGHDVLPDGRDVSSAMDELRQQYEKFNARLNVRQ